MKNDLLILGAGPGGYETAIYGYKKGLSVTLVEEKDLGGTCLNSGCIPTKALLHSAHLYEQIKRGSYFGITAKELTFDWSKIVKRKDRLLTRMRKGIETSLVGVNIVQGKGVLGANKSVLVKDNTYGAENIIIATGAKPAPFNRFQYDGNFIYSTDTIMDILALPSSIVIIGGGVIGVEFADIFSSLGVQVTVVELAETILVNIDSDARNIVQKSLEHKKVQFKTSSKIINIDSNNEFIELDSGEIIKTKAVLVCIGRRGNTAELQNITLDERGFVITDTYLKTNMADIFAIGDVTGKSNFAHSATAQGKAVVDFIASGEWSPLTAIPSVIFTSPQVASVGKLNGAFVEKKLQTVGRFQIDNDTQGFIKLYYDNFDVITGVVIVSEKAESLIGEAVVLVAKKVTLAELELVIHPHPTFSELFVN